MRYIDVDSLNECMRIVQKGNANSVEFNKRCRATDVFFDIWGMIKAQPTADVRENVKGEWIVKGQGVYCSHCKKESGYNWYGASAFSKYCPNCGADMKL